MPRTKCMFKYTWLTQGGFLFECAGTRLVVDPYMSDVLETHHEHTRLQPFPLSLDALQPDWLFCTHDHLDHFDPPTVEAIARTYPACHFVGPASCYEHFLECGISPNRCLELTREAPAQCGAFELRAVPAFHSDPHAVGAVIAAAGRRIYLSGDSNYSPELVNDETSTAEAVFICINGKLNNMNDTDALRVAEAIRPVLALPMHYGLFAENTADPQPFIVACKQLGINSFAMTPGMEYAL